MKYIKIFLALSESEFSYESNELGAFIGTLNDVYQKQGKSIFFQLKKCGDLSNALEKERRRDAYDSQIRGSQYFYLLFGRTAEKYAEEEFDAALELFRENGAPKIYTYFKELPEGESPEKSILDFMERLDKQLGHYYSKFANLDAIKLNFMLELIQDEQLDSDIEFRDGQAFIEEQPVLSLENVPLYYGNEALQKKGESKKKLDEEFAALMAECSLDPLKEGLMDRMSELGSRRKTIQDEIHEMEMAVLNMCMETAKKRHLGTRMNWREKKAMALVDQGNYEGAKNILRDEQWEVELRHGDEKLEVEKERLKTVEENQKEEWRAFISGKRNLISEIKATGLDKESVKEITDIYQVIVEIAEKYQMELGVLYNYARFLSLQNRKRESLAIAERLQQYYEAAFGVSDKSRLNLCVLLGNLYRLNQDFRKAEENLQTALEICRSLSEKDLKISEADVARAYCTMGIYLLDTDKMEEAEKLCQKALEIYARLLEGNPEDKKIYAGWNQSVNEVAILRQKMGQEKEAEALYRRALEILGDFVKRNPDSKYLLLRASNGLAGLLCTVEQYEEAECLYRQCVDILLSLCEKNPEAYEKDMAAACHNLASLLSDRRQYNEAEGLFRQARAIRYRLASKNPELYKKNIAQSSLYLADCLVKTHKSMEAAGFYKEALELFHDLVKMDSKVYKIRTAYEIGIARACLGSARCLTRNYAVSNHHLREIDLCRREIPFYEEALSIYSHLSKSEPEIYGARKAMCCYEVAILNYRKNQHWVASGGFSDVYFYGAGSGFKRTFKRMERLFRRALEIYDRLSEKKPSIYAWENVRCRIGFGDFILKRMQYAESEEEKRMRFTALEEMNEKALEILERIEESPKKWRLGAKLYYQRAIGLDFWHREKEAEKLRQKGNECVEHAEQLEQAYDETGSFFHAKKLSSAT